MLTCHDSQQTTPTGPASLSATASGAMSTDLSLEQIRTAKAEIQVLVASALKPAYRKHEIDSDQFTNINRDVSRRLYDRMGEEGSFGKEVRRDRWQSAATLEVDSALAALRKTKA